MGVGGRCKGRGGGGRGVSKLGELRGPKIDSWEG